MNDNESNINNNINIVNEKIMSVIITLSNGKVYYFSGPAFPEEYEGLTITDIKFTKPYDLPGDYHFEVINKK